ncbi:MAG: hypothetical protein Q9183_004261 [Haloplaca sp. 2 TL-2023]
MSPHSSSHRRRLSSPHSRSRSRSPPPRHRNDSDRPKVSTGGFRWKDKSRDTDRHERSDDRRLDRGYRDRGDRDRERDRERYRDQDRERDGDRDRNSRWERDDDRNGYSSRRHRDSDDRYEARDRNGRDDRRRERDGDDDRRRPDERQEDGGRHTNGSTRESFEPRTEKKEKKDKRKKEPRIEPTAEPMIIVNVNDRLGTKQAIPCLGSDTIRDFKAMVAARIGRKPYEIMLKRQGERPFKDQLTLEDYGISNGVQLDLEVDTGD